jgi:hypothetical protein
LLCVYRFGRAPQIEPSTVVHVFLVRYYWCEYWNWNRRGRSGVGEVCVSFCAADQNRIAGRHMIFACVFGKY